jgi:hypothetical protein
MPKVSVKECQRRIAELDAQYTLSQHVVALTFLALMCLTPASAAPREIEYLCFEQAQQATLTYRRGAWEAFMANCIANVTPAPTKWHNGLVAGHRIKRR